jgi:dTDP-glucose 4,6-dehydratase
VNYSSKISGVNKLTDNFWNKKSIFVSGAGGFIGSHLVEQLAIEGAQVRAFIRYNSRGDRGLLRLLPTDV